MGVRAGPQSIRGSAATLLLLLLAASSSPAEGGELQHAPRRSLLTECRIDGCGIYCGPPRTGDCARTEREKSGDYDWSFQGLLDYIFSGGRYSYTRNRPSMFNFHSWFTPTYGRFGSRSCKFGVLSIPHGQQYIGVHERCTCDDSHWTECVALSSLPPAPCTYSRGIQVPHGYWYQGVRKTCLCDNSRWTECRDHYYSSPPPQQPLPSEGSNYGPPSTPSNPYPTSEPVYVEDSPPAASPTYTPVDPLPTYALVDPSETLTPEPFEASPSLSPDPTTEVQATPALTSIPVPSGEGFDPICLEDQPFKPEQCTCDASHIGASATEDACSRITNQCSAPEGFSLPVEPAQPGGGTMPPACDAFAFEMCVVAAQAYIDEIGGCGEALRSGLGQCSGQETQDLFQATVNAWCEPVCPSLSSCGIDDLIP